MLTGQAMCLTGGDPKMTWQKAWIDAVRGQSRAKPATKQGGFKPEMPPEKRRHAGEGRQDVAGVAGSYLLN